MKKIIFTLLLCTSLFAKDFYVSPQGSDGTAGTGTIDKPVASIARAVERANRFIELRGYPDEGITTYVAEGIYKIDKPIKIDSSFSGTKDNPIVIKAQQGAGVQVIGGYKFNQSDFSKVTDASVKQRLYPQVAEKVLMLNLRERGIKEYGQLPLYGHSMGFLEAQTQYRRGDNAPELFFNSKPMTIARWPNEGFANVGDVVSQGDVIRAWMNDAKGGKAMDHEWIPPEQRNNPPQGFVFKFDKDRLQRWSIAEDLRLYGYWYYNWSDQSIQAQINPQAGTISSVQPGGYGVKKGQRFYAYNLLEELDQPGEWYLDREQGVLYIIPTEQDSDAVIHLSLMTEPFIDIDGASNIRIEGVDFGYSRGLGIKVKNSVNVSILDCRIGNTGGAGIRIDGGNNNSVIGCEVFNNGSGGVLVQGGYAKTLSPAGHIVENCLIHNYARIEKTYNPAISLDGVGNIARRNEIHNGAHLAVRFSGNNHLIELNHIYDVAKETDDMAAIYSGRSWTSRGTVVRHNLIRNVTGYKSGTHRVSGVYLDDGISGTLVEGNIFLNVAQGLMFNGGRDNTAINNVFINVENMMRHTNMRQAFVTWAAMSWRTLNQNINNTPIQSDIWKKSYPNLATMLNDEPDLPKYNTIKDNLRFNAPVIFGEKGIQDAVVEFGIVENNIDINTYPGTFNPSTGRFEFNPSSGVFDVLPALEMIPIGKIGRLEINSSKNGENIPKTITIHGKNSVLIPSSEQFFTVMLDDDWMASDNFNQKIEWSLNEQKKGVSIDSQTGVLTVTDSVKPSIIKITASIKDHQSVKAQKSVTVTDGKPTEIKIIAPKALLSSDEILLTAVERNDVRSIDWNPTNDIEWSIVGDNPAGVELDAAKSLLTANEQAPKGKKLTIRATSRQNRAITAEHTITIGDMLAECKRFESKLTADLFGKAVAMKVYHRDPQPNQSVEQGIMYLLNTAHPRIGTESDESILNDYLACGFSVITLDFENDPLAASPNLEKQLHSMLAPYENNRQWRRIKPEFFKGAEAFRPQRTYILPAGYRVSSDIVYFNLQKHGPHGIMDKTMRDWNQKIATKRDDVDVIYQPDMMKTASGKALTDTEYRMHIIYPSKPLKPVAALVRFGTDMAIDINAGNSGKRWHFTGFTLRGGAYAYLEHPYDRLYTDGYWKEVGLYSYSHVRFVGLSSAQAAFRQINAFNWLYGIDPERIFGHGHSKGQYFVTRMLNPDQENQTDYEVLAAYPQSSPEPQPYEGYSAKMRAGYQSAGWGNFVYADSDSSGNKIITADYLPTLIAVGEKDQEKVVANFHKFVEHLDSLGVENYVDLFMPGLGHEIPHEWNPNINRDNYDVYVEFFDKHSN